MFVFFSVGMVFYIEQRNAAQKSTFRDVFFFVFF